jgi:hypothetical protein
MGTKRTPRVIAGLVLFGAAGWAADVRPWTKAEVQQANELFGPRSGLTFGLSDPPEPDRQALHVHAVGIPALTQTITVATPGTDAYPPGPCFTAKLAPIDANGGGEVTLHVARPETFTIEGPNGGALHLCPGPPTIPENGFAQSAAATSTAWTAGDVRDANAIFGDHSGFRFTVTDLPPDPVLPPDPIRQALHLDALPAGQLAQNIVVETGGSPPDPCFNAVIAPTSLGGAITLHVSRPGSFAIEGPKGEPLDLCNANGDNVSE